MKVNIFAEDFLFLRYIGCSTAAKSLYRQLSKMKRVEVFWNSKERGFDIIHYHTFGPLALLNMRSSKGIKILTAHSTPRLNMGNLILSKYFNYYYPYSYRKFEHIIALTKRCQKEVERIAPDVPTTIIPNGVDRAHFKRSKDKRKSFRDRYRIGDDEKVVLAVGQQTPRKGIYDFIELSIRHPEMRWIWQGGYPYGIFSKDYFKIERMKKKCGKNILFPGFIPDITEAYSGADVLFMPSHAETFGLVVLEALSCSLPVIVRDIPEFRELFGKVAIFFRTPEDASRKMKDDDLLRRSSKKARQFTEKYDIKRIAEMHYRLYRRLMES